MIKKISLFLLCTSRLVFANPTTENVEYQYLNAIALKYDSSHTSGKGSNGHNYAEVYARYLAPLKNDRFKFLEIGIFEGNGVQLWENYFTNADLHFIDITFDKVKYFSERSHYYLADQANKKDLLRVMEESGGNFDIIIDDGGHTMKQQLVSFKTLFPYLNSGGFYIIEDLHTSYWKSHEGGGSLSKPKAGAGTFVQFLKDLIDDVNFVGARTGSANHDTISEEIKREITSYQREIYSMHFYDSLCIIIKR